jgi:hypothetical protein
MRPVSPVSRAVLLFVLGAILLGLMVLAGGAAPRTLACAAQGRQLIELRTMAALAVLGLRSLPPADGASAAVVARGPRQSDRTRRSNPALYAEEEVRPC